MRERRRRKLTITSWKIAHKMSITSMSFAHEFVSDEEEAIRLVKKRWPETMIIRTTPVYGKPKE